jgi:hypothetical protein
MEAENHTLEENADAYEIERLTLLQNIADMQQQVEEAEVQVAALQAIVALQPLPPVQVHLSLTRDNQRIIKTFCNTPP